MLNNKLQVLIPDCQKHRSIFDILGVSKMDVWKAAARQAYTGSPSISSLWNPENLKYISDLEFADIQQLAQDGHFDKKRITKEEFVAEYKESGLKYNPNFTKEKIDNILERKKQREINEYIISKGKGDSIETIGKFVVEVIAGNIVVSFIFIIVLTIIIKRALRSTYKMLREKITVNRKKKILKQGKWNLTPNGKSLYFTFLTRDGDYLPLREKNGQMLMFDLVDSTDLESIEKQKQEFRKKIIQALKIYCDRW